LSQDDNPAGPVGESLEHVRSFERGTASTQGVMVFLAC